MLWLREIALTFIPDLAIITHVHCVATVRSADWFLLLAFTRFSFAKGWLTRFAADGMPLPFDTPLASI
jgi:hypothetical protein